MNDISNKITSKSLSTLKAEVRQLFDCIEMVQKEKASIDLIKTKLAIVNEGTEINPRINNIKKNEKEVENVPIELLIEECKKVNKKNLLKLKKAVERLSLCIDYVKIGYSNANMNWIKSALEFVNEGMAVISRINADLESYKAMMVEN